MKEVQCGDSILLVATLVCFNSFPFVESHLEWMVMLESPQTESICNFHPNISWDIVKVSSVRTESKKKKKKAGIQKSGHGQIQSLIKISLARIALCFFRL